MSSRNKDKKGKHRSTADLIEIAPQQIVEPATTRGDSSRAFDSPRATLARGESDDYYNSHPHGVAVAGGGPPGVGAGYVQSPVDIQPGYGGEGGGPPITSAGGGGRGYGGGYGYTTAPPQQSHYPTASAGGGYGGYGATTGYHPNASYTHSDPPPHNSYPAYNAPPTQHNASYVAHAYQAPPPHSQNMVPYPSYHGLPPRQSYGSYTHPQKYDGNPPRRDSTSSSSGSSYVEISRYATLPALKQNPLAAVKTFFTAPSGSKRRAIKKRPSASDLGRRNSKKKHGRRHSSSSSEVDSDLAYGTAFVKRHRLRRRRKSKGGRSPEDRGYGSPRRQGSRSPRRASPGRYRDTGYQPSSNPSQIMPGVFPGDHRELFPQERDQQPSLSRRESEKYERKKKKSADEEIRKIGEDLHKLAKQQNKLHLAEAAKRGSVNSRRDDSGRHGLGPKEVERGLGSSKPVKHAHGTYGMHGHHEDDDSDDWEDDSSSDSDSSSADSALAFGGEDIYPRFRRSPSPRTQGGPRRKSTIVDPRLFGPNNSLAGAVTRPVGFGEVDIMGPGGSTPVPPPNVKQTGYFRSPLPSPKPAARGEREVEESRRNAKKRAELEMERRDSERNRERDGGRDAELRQVFPMPTDDPHAFDALTSTPQLNQVGMEKRPSFHARTDSLPLRQPKPMSPVRQQVYDGQVSSPELTRSHDHALGGLAGAALAAAIAEEKRARREALHRDEEERRRGEDREIDSMRMFRDDMARRNGKSPELLRSKPATVMGQGTPIDFAVGDRQGRESRVDPFQYQASDLGDDVFEKTVYAPKPLHERIAARAVASNPDTSRRGSGGGTPVGSCKGKESAAGYRSIKDSKYYPDGPGEKKDDSILSNLAGVAAAAIGGIGIAKMASKAAERGPDTDFRRHADFGTKPEIDRSQTFPTRGSRSQKAGFLDNEGPTVPLTGLESNLEIGNSIEREYTPAIVLVERKPKWARDVSPIPPTRRAYSPEPARVSAVLPPREGSPPPQIADAAPSFARFEGGMPSRLPHDREPSFVSYEDPEPFSQPADTSSRDVVVEETKPGHRRESLRRFSSDADHRYAAMSSDYFSSRETVRGRSHTRSPSPETREGRDTVGLRLRSRSQSRMRSKSPNVRQARHSDQEARKRSYRKGNDEDWRHDERAHEGRTRDNEGERDRALDEREKMYDEVENFTAPLPAAAISSAVHAIYAQDARRSRDQSPASHRSQNPVQDKADRIYKETVLARRIAGSHSGENSPPRVVTPPAMERREREKEREKHNNRKGLYSEPDADFVFDHEMHPDEEKIFTPVVLRKSWPILAEMEPEGPFDPRMLGLNRPLLNIVRATPEPEKQIKLQMPRSRSQSRERKSETSKEIEDKPKCGIPVLVDEISDDNEPTSRSVADPKPLERKVSWGENETQHYDVVTPYPDNPSHNPFTTAYAASPPTQSPTDGKRTPPWEQSHPAGKALPSIPPPSNDEDYTHAPLSHRHQETLREVTMATSAASSTPPMRPKPKSLWSNFTPDLAARIRDQEAAAALLVNASTIGFADGDEGDDVNSPDKVPSRLEELRERERIWVREEEDRERQIGEEERLEREARHAERDSFKKGEAFEYRGIIVEPELSPENSASVNEEERGRDIELDRHDSGSPPPVGPKPSVMPGGFEDDTDRPVFAYPAASPPGSDVDTVIYHQPFDLSTKAELGTSSADNSRPVSRDQPKIGSDDSFVVVEADPTPQLERDETMIVVVDPEHGKSESFAVVSHPEQSEETQSLLRNAASEGNESSNEDFVMPMETPEGDIVTPSETDRGIDGIGAPTNWSTGGSAVIVDVPVEPSGEIMNEPYDLSREDSAVIVDAPLEDVRGAVEIAAPAQEGESTTVIPIVLAPNLEPADAQDAADATRDGAKDPKIVKQEVVPDTVDAATKNDAIVIPSSAKESGEVVSTLVETAADPSESSSSGKKLNKKQRKALEKKQAAEAAQATLEAAAISVAAGAGVALIADALKDEPKNEEMTREVIEGVADEIRDAPVEELKGFVDASLEGTFGINDAPTREKAKPEFVEAQNEASREVIDAPIEQPPNSVETGGLNEQKVDEAPKEVVSTSVNDTAVDPHLATSGTENDSSTPAKKLNKKQRKALEKTQAAQREAEAKREAELAAAAAESTIEVDAAANAAGNAPVGESDTHNGGKAVVVQNIGPTAESSSAIAAEDSKDIIDAPLENAQRATEDEPTKIVVEATEPQPEEGVNTFEEAVQIIHDVAAEPTTVTESPLPDPLEAGQAIINEQAMAEPMVKGPTSEEQAAINEQATAEPIFEHVDALIEIASKEVDITDTPINTPQGSSAEVTVSEEPPKNLNKKQRKAWLKAKKAADEAAALEAANAPVDVPAEAPIETPAMEVLPTSAIVDIPVQESHKIVDAAIEPLVETPVVEVLPGDEIVDVPTEVKHDTQSAGDLTSTLGANVESSTTKNAFPEPSRIVTIADALAATGYTIRESESTPTSTGDVLEAEISPTMEELQAILDAGPPTGLNKKRRKEWERATKTKIAEAEAAAVAQAELDAQIKEDKRDQDRELVIDDIIPEVLPTPIYEDESGAFASTPLATPPVKIEDAVDEREHKPKSRVVSLSMAEAAALAKSLEEEKKPQLTRKLSKKEKEKKKLGKEAKERQLAELDEAAGDADGSSTPADTDGGARVSVPVDAFADLASAGDVVDREWNESGTTLSKKKKKKEKGKAVEVTDEVPPSEAPIETGAEELKFDIQTEEFKDIIPAEPSREESREIIEQTDDDDAFHSANEVGPNDQATDDGNLTETEFKSPNVVPADKNSSNGHTEPSVEPITEDAKESNIEVAAEENFAPVSGKKKRKKKKKDGSGAGTGTDASPEESAAEQESFLAKAGTLGAGVGLVGAAAANALVSQSDEVEASLRSGDENVHQQSNADGAERWSQPLSGSVQGKKGHEDDDDNKTVMGLEDIRERNEGAAGLSEEKEMAIDPEIKERKIRPSIDPQFGDFLPLPPSDPGSPHPELGDEASAIGLPASPPPGSPETTRELNSFESPITPRKRASGSHIPRSPSVSAVPLNFLLRNRGSGSMPSSPITPQVGATSPTRSEVLGLSLGSKERKRPTSWDSSKEMQPFQLPEFARSHSRSNSVTSLRAMPPLLEKTDTVEEQAVATGEQEKSDAQPIGEDIVAEMPMGLQTSVESQPVEKVSGKTPHPTSATETATESSAIDSGSSKKSKKKKKKGKQAAVLEPELILETALPTEIVSETPVEITADAIQESVGDTPIETTRHVIGHAAVIGVTQDVIDKAPTEIPAEITEPASEASKPAAIDGSDEIQTAIVEAIVVEERIQKSTQMPVETVEPVVNIPHEDPTEECSVEPVVVQDAAADIPTIDRPLETLAEDLSSTGFSTATSSKSKKNKKGKQAVVQESEPVVETSLPTAGIAETRVETNTDAVHEPIGEAPVESTREIAEAPIVTEVPQETIAEAFMEVPTEIIEAAGDAIEPPAHENIVVDFTKVEEVPADRSIPMTKMEEPLQAPTEIVQSVVAIRHEPPSEQASAVPTAGQEATTETPMIEIPFPILAEQVTKDLSSTGFSTATSSKSKKKKKKVKKGSATDVIPEPETVAETPSGSLGVDDGLATEDSMPASTFATAMDEKPEYLSPSTDDSTQDLQPVMETIIAPVEAPVEYLSQPLHKETSEVLDAPTTVPEPSLDPSISLSTEQEQAVINTQAISESIPEETGTALAEPFARHLKATDTPIKMPAQDIVADMAEAPIIEPLIREVGVTEAPTNTPALAVESQPPTSSNLTESEEPPKGLNKKQRKAWLKAKKAADEIRALEAANTPAEAPVESGTEAPAHVISEAQIVEDVTAAEPLPIVEEAVQDEAPIESSPGLTTAEALRSAGYFIAHPSAPVDDTSIADEPPTDIPPPSASDTPLAKTENATQTVDELRSVFDAGPPAGLNKKKRKEWEKAQKAKLAEAEAAAAQVAQPAAEADIVATHVPERGVSIEEGACKVLPSDMPIEGTGDVAAEPISAFEPIAKPSLTEKLTTDDPRPPKPAEIMPKTATFDEPDTKNAAKEILLPETPLDTPAKPASEKPSTGFMSTSSKESKKKKKKGKGATVEPEPETPMAEQSYDAGNNQPQGQAAKNLKLALDVPIQLSEVVLEKPVFVEVPNETDVDASIETSAEITEPVPELAQVMADIKPELSLKEATKDVSSETAIPASEIIASIEAPEGAANEVVTAVELPTTDDIPPESLPGLTTAKAFARGGFGISAEPMPMSKDKGKELVETASETPLSETPIETPAEAAAEDEWAPVKKPSKKERRALEKKQAREAEFAVPEAESAPMDDTVVKSPLGTNYSVDKSVTEQPIEPLLPPTNTASVQVKEVVLEVPLPEFNLATPLETPADIATESERAPTRKLGKNKKKAGLKAATDEPSSAPIEVVEPILEQPAEVSGRAIEERPLGAIKATEQLSVDVEQPFKENIETDARLSESAYEVPIEISTEDEQPSLQELQIVLDGGPPPGLNKKKRKEWERTQKAKLAKAEVKAALLASSRTPLRESIEKDVVTDSAIIPDPTIESGYLEVGGELTKNDTPEALQPDSSIEAAIETPFLETPVETSVEKLRIPEAASEVPIKMTADDECSSTPAKDLNKKQRKVLEQQRGEEALEIELAAAAPSEIREEAPTDVVDISPGTERQAETEPPQDVATEILPEASVETATEIPLPEIPLETPAQTSTEAVCDSLDGLIGASRKKSKRKKGKKGAVCEAGPELQLVAKEASRDLSAEVIVLESSAEEPKIVPDEAPLRPAPVTFDSFRAHLDIEELGRAVATAIPLPSQGATPYETDIDPAVWTPEQVAAPLPPTFDSIRTHLGDEELGRALGTALPLPSIGATPYETDNDFATTIAAGLEASGFDAEKVLEDPTFSKQVSPRQSAEQLKVITEDPAISRHLQPRVSQEQLARDNDRPESPLNENEGVNERLFSKKTKKKAKGKSPIVKKDADKGTGHEGGMETVELSDVPTSEYDALPSEPISPSASKKKKANKGKARAASIVDRMPSTTSVVKEPGLPLKNTAIVAGVGAGVAAFASDIALLDISEAGSSKNSKKKKGKIVDMRIGGDNLFDDPALWEGADPKSFEEAPHGNCVAIEQKDEGGEGDFMGEGPVEKEEEAGHEEDFASTIAAGLEASGFDSGEIMQDPTFSRHGSPTAESQVVKDPTMARAMSAADDSLDKSTPLLEDTTARPTIQREDTYATRDFQGWNAEAALLQQPIFASRAEILVSGIPTIGALQPSEEVRRKVSDLVEKFEVCNDTLPVGQNKDENLTRQVPDVDQENVAREPLIAAKGSVAPETFQEPELLSVSGKFEDEGPAPKTFDLERRPSPTKDPIDDVKDFFEQKKLIKNDQKFLDRRNALAVDKQKASDEAMRRRYQELEEEVVQSRGGTPVQELRRSEESSRTESSAEGPSVEISAAPIESVDVNIVDRMSMESEERPVLTQKLSKKEQKKIDKQRRQRELECGKEGDEIVTAGDVVAAEESEAQEMVKASELEPELPEAQPSVKPSVTRKLSKKQQKSLDKQRRLELASSALSADDLQKGLGKDKNTDNTTTETEQELLNEAAEEPLSSTTASNKGKKVKDTAESDNGSIQQRLGTKSTLKGPPNKPLRHLVPTQGLQGEVQQPGHRDEAQQHASSPPEDISEPTAQGDRAIQLSCLRDEVSPSPREIHTSHGDRSVQEEGSESSPQEALPGKDKEAELVRAPAHPGEGEAQVPNSSTASQGSPHPLEARAISETHPTGEAARSLEGPSTSVDHSSTPQNLALEAWSSISQEKPEIGDDKEWERTPSRLPAVPEEDSPGSDKERSPTTPIKSSAPRGFVQEYGDYAPAEQQSRSFANEKRYIRDSGIQSSEGSQEQSFTDDVLGRRSWPPVDENTQTVDLGRKKRTKQKESPYAQITPINIAKAATGLGLAGASLGNTSTLSLSASPSLGTPRHLSDTHRSVSERINTPDIFDRRGTPDSVISAKSRPVSVLSNRSYISSRTPPLRRSDRRVSGDLRSLSQLDLSQPSLSPKTGKVSAAAAHDSGSSSDRSAVTTTAKRHSLGATTRERDNIYAQPTSNESRPRLKSEEMAQTEVYDGFGEGHIGSPRSPTRPHSMRRQKSIQSMQISELQRQLEQAKLEIQRLSQGHAADTNADLEDRIQELSQENITLSRAKAELDTKVEENEELKTTNHRLRQQRDELKKREQAVRDNYVDLQNTHTHIQAELEAAQAKSAEFDAGLAGSLQAKVLEETKHKDETIEELRAEIQLKDDELARRDALIRDKEVEISQLRAQIEAMKEEMLGDDFLDVVDDKHIAHACRRLYHDLYKFVGEYWKRSRKRPYCVTKDFRSPRVVAHMKKWGIDAEELLDRLDNCLLDDENIDDHVGDGGRRHNIYMTLLSTILYERVFSRYFFALSPSEENHISKIEKTVSDVGPPSALADWRAKTLTFHSKNKKWQVARADEMRSVTDECLYTLRSLTDPQQTIADSNGVTRYVLDELWGQLFSCVKEAVDLVVSLRTQKAKYTVGPMLHKRVDAKGRVVKHCFHAEFMREISGSCVPDEDLEAGKARLQSVLFPVVKRIGDDRGEGEEETIIFNSRVLVQKEGKHSWVLKDSVGEGSTRGGRESRMSRRSLETRGDSSMLDA